MDSDEIVLIGGGLIAAYLILKQSGVLKLAEDTSKLVGTVENQAEKVIDTGSNAIGAVWNNPFNILSDNFIGNNNNNAFETIWNNPFNILSKDFIGNRADYIVNTWVADMVNGKVTVTNPITGVTGYEDYGTMTSHL